MSDERHSVLFVCTANRIRSVMAEALFREMVAQHDPEGVWRIDSAGTWATDGRPPMPFAIKAMEAEGIEIRDHQSQSVDSAAIDEFALVLVMERGHKESLLWEFPALKGRIYLISEMDDGSYEVDDPVSGPLQNHANTVEVLRRILTNGYQRIVALSLEDTAGGTGE